ncbi:glycosyltransferase family A protein [Kribbia dieselivorans]|uniref:glycosyltransferase family A protein n=1 Tax=Kribbia dieselivorans TaxID=331526 RepID=UPI0009F93D01|nr:glycosyltransferase family A protein [Kribbia dieselivorans]
MTAAHPAAPLRAAALPAENRESLAVMRVAAGAHRRGASTFASVGLRTRAPAVGEALALAASDGTLTVGEIADRIDAADVPAALLDPDRCDSALALAVLWAGGRDGDWPERAHRLFSALIERHGPGLGGIHERTVFAQNAYVLGHTAQVRGTLPMLGKLNWDVRQRLETDLAHPSLGGDHDQWLSLLTAPFVEAGLAAFGVDVAAPTLFDGLHAAPPRQVDGPLVTVIMPTWRPDHGLRTSVMSIINQTYANLQVILVDDASGPEWADTYEEAAALDERITVLRMPVNGGSYVGRNAALAVADGAYVTFQDGDDWSHPERIERQVAALLEDPLASGSRSEAFRATEELTHQWVGYRALRQNASSLMVRRSTIERLGTFDTTRKGADSEYHERIRTLLGATADVQTPLAITRLRSGSLSRADFTLDWAHPDRITYRQSYTNWHHQLLTEGGVHSPQLPLRQDPAQRAFPAPRSFVARIPGTPASTTTYDVVHLTDATLPDLTFTSGLIDPAPTTLRVGLVHLDDPTEPAPHRGVTTPALRDRLLEGRLEQLSSTDAVAASVAVVSRSTILEMPPAEPMAVQVERVLVVLDADPIGVPDIATLRATCPEWLGCEPEWVCLTTAEAQRWRAAGLEVSLLHEAVPEMSTGQPSDTPTDRHALTDQATPTDRATPRTAARHGDPNGPGSTSWGRAADAVRLLFSRPPRSQE